MECYSDASHAGDNPHDTFSQTGVIVVMNGAPVYWCSKKQVDSTAISSASAEIYALSEAVRAVRFHAWICADMQVQVNSPLQVFVDNKQAITFQKGTCLKSKLRGCVSLRWAWVKELKEAKDIDVRHVPGRLQKADIFTKGLPNYKFQEQLKTLRGGLHLGHYMEVVQLAKAK